MQKSMNGTLVIDGANRLRNLVLPHDDVDPWIVSDDLGRGWIQTAALACVAVWIDGLLIQSLDLPLAMAAKVLAPEDSDRHDPLADSMRAEAGMAALNISDAMVRARILDSVDGWDAIRGKLIDKNEEGELHASANDDITVQLLSVVCPSTGRKYCLLVPEHIKTVRSARAWLNMGIQRFDVET